MHYGLWTCVFISKLIYWFRLWSLFNNRRGGAGGQRQTIRLMFMAVSFLTALLWSCVLLMCDVNKCCRKTHPSCFQSVMKMIFVFLFFLFQVCHFPVIYKKVALKRSCDLVVGALWKVNLHPVVSSIHWTTPCWLRNVPPFIPVSPSR